MTGTIYWHFAADTLRDGSPLPRAGDRLPAITDIEPCRRGYHASKRAIDALNYAPGTYVAQVRLHGEQIEHGSPVDKVVAEVRENVTDYVDVTEQVRSFARWSALQVIHLWNAPEVVRQYLMTGDELLQTAAAATAIAAGDDAAYAAACATTAYPRYAAADAAYAATADADTADTADAAYAAADAAAIAATDSYAAIVIAQDKELTKLLVRALS